MSEKREKNVWTNKQTCEDTQLFHRGSKEIEDGDTLFEAIESSANLGSEACESEGNDESMEACGNEGDDESMEACGNEGDDESMADCVLDKKCNEKLDSKSSTKENIKMIVKDVVIACAIALAISFFVRPTLVRETSMEPTVHPNDYIIMSKQAYTLGKIERGDIIVFQSDIRLDDTHNKLLIKRVIGLAGDIITISDGNVYRNGDKLHEGYIAQGGTVGEIYNLVVPEGQVFVMGDHRGVSIDSRKLGCIQEKDIVGQAVFRLYPFNQIGVI